MVNLNDIYKAKGEFLRGADLKGFDPMELTISGSEVRTIGTDEKLIVQFDEIEQEMPLNVTNARRIAVIAEDDDSDNWKGTKITVAHEMVEYQDKLVDGLRVQMKPKITGKTAPLLKGKQSENPAPEEGLDDQVPF